jgi:hypothetical protein
LPAQLPQLSEKELKEVDNLPEKADLTRVHAQILFHKAALSTGAARAVLCTDLSASNFSRHQVFVGELPPLKPRSEVLALCAKGKLRHLTCSEVLAAKGYRLGEVNLHLLPRSTAIGYANAATPVPVAILCLALGLAIEKLRRQ